MKLIIPDVIREFYLCGFRVREVRDKLNKLQSAAGTMKHPIKSSSIREYTHKTPPQERIYALCAILGKHPKNVFKVVYDEEKLKYYQELLKKIES